MVGPMVQAIHPLLQQGTNLDTQGMHHLSQMCLILYIISKVRGYKTIVKLFPHQVEDLTMVAAAAYRSTGEECTWQVRYVLLLWLSLLLMAPFDLSLFEALESSVVKPIYTSEVGKIPYPCVGAWERKRETERRRERGKGGKIVQSTKFTHPTHSLGKWFPGSIGLSAPSHWEILPNIPGKGEGWGIHPAGSTNL